MSTPVKTTDSTDASERTTQSLVSYRSAVRLSKGKQTQRRLCASNIRRVIDERLCWSHKICSALTT